MTKHSPSQTISRLIVMIAAICAACLLPACEARVGAVQITATPLIPSLGVTLGATWTSVPEVSAVPNTPTAAPTSTPTLTFTPSLTFTPTATYTPSLTLTPSPTFTPTVAPTVISTLIPGTFGGDLDPWTPPPPTYRVAGNFFLGRPFAEQHSTFWAREYSYGSTRGGQLQVHHGVDIANPPGTPIIAAAEGTVYYAGSDIQTVFGPQPDFYGRLVVIEHPFMYSDGTKIYSLYGHMRETIVQAGEQVEAGQVIGFVGSTGVALGPHLHFEVRIGDPRRYDATRNPELWIAPYPNRGVLAGRVMDIYGNALGGIKVEIQAPGSYNSGVSYIGTSVNGDNILGENYAIPDVPAGYHTVTVRIDDVLRFRKVVYIWPGQISWLDIHLQPER